MCSVTVHHVQLRCTWWTVTLHTNSRRRQSYNICGPPVRGSWSFRVIDWTVWSSVFCCCGPTTWNPLPDNLRDSALSLSMFRRHLKTHFCEILTRRTYSTLEMLKFSAAYRKSSVGCKKPVTANISLFDFLHVSASLDCGAHCGAGITSRYKVVCEIFAVKHSCK